MKITRKKRIKNDKIKKSCGRINLGNARKSIGKENRRTRSKMKSNS